MHHTNFDQSFCLEYFWTLLKAEHTLSVAYLGFGKGAWWACRARAYNGGLGWSPQRPGAKKLKHFLLLNVQWKLQIRPFFRKFGNAENHSVISDAISHGDFNRILYRYEKRHQTLLNFAILAGKRQKRTFSYKVSLKNFHGRAKGGPSHHGPPPKYATALCLLLDASSEHFYFWFRWQTKHVQGIKDSYS